MPPEGVVKVNVQLELVFVEVLEQRVGAEDSGDADKLVVVVGAVEKGFFAEDDACEHAPDAP
jgi:hypothetical protein